MLLALVSLAAAMELRVVVKAPDGTNASVTAQVADETVLNNYPMPLGRKYTALVSATSKDRSCTVDVTIYKGDPRKGRKIMAPRLILTEFETAYLEHSTQSEQAGQKSKTDWQVEATLQDSFDKAPDAAAVPPPASTAPATPAPAPTP